MNFYILTPLCLLMTWNGMIWLLFAFLKRRMLKKAGVSAKDLDLIASNRQNNGFSLQKLIQQHGEMLFRRTDAIARKGLHFLSTFFALIFLHELPISMQEKFLAVSLYGSVIISTVFIVYKTEKPLWLDWLIFSAMPRVRDGILARKNQIAAYTASLLHFLPIGLFVLWFESRNLDENLGIMLTYIIYLPFSVGDALGELVGAFWGRQNVQVTGVGDINRKSWLGTWAVFVGTWLCCATAVFLTTNAVIYHLLAFIIAVVTTGVELKSPRGTDNFFIPAACALVTVIFMELLIIA